MKKKTWEDIEEQYFLPLGKSEFHGYIIAGFVEHWDHRIVQVLRKFDDELSAQEYLEDLQARINKISWPKFWWKQFAMKAYLKLYKVDQTKNVNLRKTELI